MKNAIKTVGGTDAAVAEAAQQEIAAQTQRAATAPTTQTATPAQTAVALNR